MAGFSALIAPDTINVDEERCFHALAEATARYKQIAQAPAVARGRLCIAAKFDTLATIHPGIIHDEQTGSWLLAAGTVVPLEGDQHPENGLRRLLEDYVKNRAKALEGYDGHFALIIYHGQEESVSFVSDPMGLFSIFIAREGGKIFVSSSAFAVALQVQAQPDILAIEHFLRAGRLDGDKTLWQGVTRMLGGRVFKITSGRTEENTYWMPTCDPSVTRLSMEDALRQYEHILSTTFSRLLEREEKTWVDLTGGFDTRLVATFVSKLDVPFIPYCMGPADHPDVKISKMISNAMGWEFFHSQLAEHWEADLDDIFATTLGNGDGGANLLRFAVTRRGVISRNSVSKTNVVGIGGENLRGYYWLIEREKIGRTSKVHFEALIDHLIPSYIPQETMRCDRSREVRQELLVFIQRLCSTYAQYPNTVQLDRVEMYRDAGHGGAYLSAGASLQRSLAPLCFKAPVNFAFSLNYRWKFPRHHLFLRKLLERENALLASLPTTTGGPATPIRLFNFYQFWPLWKALGNRAIAVGSKKFLRKALQVWPQSSAAGYPLPAWREAFHQYAVNEGMLDFDRMVSAGLYNQEAFNGYLASHTPGAYPGSEFIDHVISIEMAMRATGASIP